MILKSIPCEYHQRVLQYFANRIYMIDHIELLERIATNVIPRCIKTKKFKQP